MCYVPYLTRMNLGATFDGSAAAREAVRSADTAASNGRAHVVLESTGVISGDARKVIKCKLKQPVTSFPYTESTVPAIYMRSEQ